MGVDATFGGLHCRSAAMSLTAGITPDVGTLVMPATARGRVPLKARLVLRDGNGGSVTLPGIYSLEGTTQELPGGKEISVQVADRRCLWAWDEISYAWNRLNVDGSENPERSLHLLLADLVAHLPGARTGSLVATAGIYPPVAWDQDNTAQALQELCDEFGLIASMSVSGKVHVTSADEAAGWPGGPYKAKETGTGGKLKPAKIVIAGAPLVNEKTFEDLVAVGLEIDGTIRPIADLSYKPASGWGTEPITFPNVSGGTYNGTAYSAEEARELARKCIWKWYALDLTDNERKQYLPLLDVRSEIVESQGNEEHGKPYVNSENAQWDGTSWKKDAKGRISSGFTIDNELGIVKFEEPVYSITTEGGSHGGLVAPDIDLRAAYEQKPDPDDAREQICSYYYARAVAGGAAGTKLLHKIPELRVWYITGTAQNEANVEAYAKLVAQRLERQFTGGGPEARTYPRIVNATPRGVLRSVQWTVSTGGGATTTIQKNFDRPIVDGMPAYEEKLRRRRQRVVLNKVDHGQRVYVAGRGDVYATGGQF